MSETKYIDLGPSESLGTISKLDDIGWNSVQIHRHPEWIMQKWGNLCCIPMTRILVRAADDMPIRWYHEKIYNFCKTQYDKYGDYYRILDSSFSDFTIDQPLEIGK